MNNSTVVCLSNTFSSGAFTKSSVPKLLTSVEVAAIEQILIERNELAVLVAFQLGVENGMRIGEILDADLEDLDLTNRCLSIGRNDENKRPLFFSSKVEDLLRKWLDIRHIEPFEEDDSSDEPLLCRENGGRLLPHDLLGRLFNAIKSAGIRGLYDTRVDRAMANGLYQRGLHAALLMALGRWKPSVCVYRFEQPLTDGDVWDETLVSTRLKV